MVGAGSFAVDAQTMPMLAMGSARLPILVQHLPRASGGVASTGGYAVRVIAAALYIVIVLSEAYANASI